MSASLSPPENLESPPRTATDFPILVSGDVVVDHHIYEGERMTAAAYNRRGFRVKREHGGAAGLYKFLEELLQAAKKAELELREQAKAGAQIQSKGDRLFDYTLSFAPRLGDVDSQPTGNHAFATWKPFQKDPKDKKDPGKQKVWRVSQLLGYGDSERGAGVTTPAQLQSPAESLGAPGGLLILDDAGYDFRHRQMKDSWSLPETSDHADSSPESESSLPKWLLLKMSVPVCQGDLWPEISGKFGDRLICIVSAGDLRKECVNLSTGLSWERTVEDIRFALNDSPALNPLSTKPRHLIVTFSGDGALWLNNTNREQPEATLVFEADGYEGRWEHRFDGKAFGYLSCMMAAITLAIVRKSNDPDLASALAAGLAAMRNLRELGHGIIGEADPAGFPKARLAKAILDSGGDFSFSRVPWSEKEQEPYAATGSLRRIWRIVEMSQSPFPGRTMPSLLGLARQVVLQGQSAIKRLPHAAFGDLLTADRMEIEALRTIRRAMRDYNEARKAKKPLSIGVFGPPGAGKSFGVQQIANDVFGEEAWLSFNLSQFKDSTDLVGAFHQVRDKVLSGITPVVFWDEFDSKEYEWLQYLLAPMQDGRFQHGQLNHAIGKCVFIFAGGTSHTFEEFGPPEALKDAVRTYQLRKGPDFHSRLDAFYNVLGPNQRLLPAPIDSPPSETTVEDESDVCAPLRRALLIRALLRVPKDARLDFDPELLDALLRVRRYKHGARSLEKLALSLQPATPDEPIRRSSLPPLAQIGMHVWDDAKHPDLAFDKLLTSNRSFGMSKAILPIAKAIHKAWQPSASAGNELDVSWDSLSEADQQDNMAAARRIPAVLALAGLIVKKGAPEVKDVESPPRSDTVDLQIEHHLERLAEAEHEGWMAHRKKAGWTFAKDKDIKQKKHPLLIPYDELPELEKQKDRDAVCNYREHLKNAGYHIDFESAAMRDIE